MRKRTTSVKNINKIPDTAGVYFLINKQGETFYIGKSTNIRERLKSHLSPKKRSFGDFAKETARVAWVPTSGEIEALILEASAIKKYRPKYNILLTDDKKYFYVKFANLKSSSKTKSVELPYLAITHRPQDLPGTIYVGPFTEGGQIKLLLRYLRRIFPYYTSSRHPKLPCSYCHLELCPGPVADLAQYKRSMRIMQKILEGKRPSVEHRLIKDMKRYAANLDFERAQKIRETLDALRNIFAHKHFLDRTPKKFGTSYSAKTLGCLLGSNKPINTMEGYDISNIQGREPVASMVRFSDGKPDKTLYRKFKMRLPEKPNDFAMIREVVTRRLAHPEWPYPQLFLIDGGKGQLSAALSALHIYALCNKLPLVALPLVAALAKQENELFIPGKLKSIHLTKVDAGTRHLLMHVRDEAHRFAIAYHRKLHRRKFKMPARPSGHSGR